MTKAATEAAKRRRKRAQAECAISGVTISAERKATQRAANGDTGAMLHRLRQRCSLMGWPEDDTHMQRARDQRLATLYGRLAAAGMIDQDAYDGIREWEGLDIRYRREVLGTETAVEDARLSGTLDPHERIRDLTNSWMAAEGVIDCMPKDARECLRHCVKPNEGIAPKTAGAHYAKALEVAGHALARHFGLRA